MSGFGKRKLSIYFKGAFSLIAAQKIHLITETGTLCTVAPVLEWSFLA